MQRNADILRRVRSERMDYPWQRQPHCSIHHVLMYWSIALAQQIKPQDELETAQCFVCALCEQEKRQKQIASRSLNSLPDYQPGLLSRTVHTTRLHRIALAAIPTHNLLSAPQPTTTINPVTPLPETRQALFSDVASIADSLILWPDEDATEMREACHVKKRDTAQIPAPHVEELLYQLMHVQTHEQSTDENEQL